MKPDYETNGKEQGGDFGGGQSSGGGAAGRIETGAGESGAESVPSGGGVGDAAPHIEGVGELPSIADGVFSSPGDRLAEEGGRSGGGGEGVAGSPQVAEAVHGVERKRSVERGPGSRSIMHNGEKVGFSKMWLFLGEQMWLHPFPEEERAVIERAAAMSKRAPGVRAHTVVSWLAWAVRYGAFGGGVGQVKAWREDSTSCLEVCWRYCLVKALEELAESEAVEGDEISEQTRKVFQDVNKLEAIRKGRKHHLHKPGGDVYMMLEAATVRTLDMAAEHIHRLSGGALFSDRGHNTHANMILRAALEALVVRDEVIWPPRFLAGSQDPDLEAAEDLIRGLGEGGGL